MGIGKGRKRSTPARCACASALAISALSVGGRVGADGHQAHGAHFLKAEAPDVPVPVACPSRGEIT